MRREIGPLVDFEGSDIADATCEPLEGLESVHGCEQVGQVLAFADVYAALNALEAEAFECFTDVSVGLGDTLGMPSSRVLDDEIEGYSKHQRAIGSLRMSAKGYWIISPETTKRTDNITSLPVDGPVTANTS